MASRLQDSMERHPLEFAIAMEKRMAKQLAEDAPAMSSKGVFEDDGRLAARYLEDEIPMGKQRILGHMAFILAHVHCHL
eukprot:3658883-Lingulodinium_polyedra.AAC.1